MLTTIHITVRDRVPTITAGEDVISHNSDYVAEFEFDEEWQDKVKTVYFVCEDGSYQAVVMSGNSCGVPMLDGEHRRIFVGVQAGSAEKPSVLKTTRPCCLKVKDSIADLLGEQIPDPPPSVYEQIIAMLESITSPTWDSVQNKPFTTLGGGLAVDENGVLSAEGGSGGSPNAVQYVAQTLTDEQKAQARENIGAGTSSFSGSYNDLTSKPTIPTQVTIDSTLKQSGQAADAKAVGDALQHFTPTEALNSEFREIELTFATKLDKNQGAGNAGKILGVGEDGIVVPQDKPSITVDSALSSTSENPVQNKVVTAALAGKITAPTTAAVGQIIKVKSVDGTGKPTEWEAVDMPSGGGGETWEKLVDTSLAEAVESVTYTFDNCKRVKALIAPAIANGEFVSGWIRITINNAAYPAFNGKVNFYEGIDFEIDSEYPPYVQGDINVITNTTIQGIVSGKHAASLENIAPNGVTEFGCQTAALLKAGTKIEIWGIKS